MILDRLDCADRYAPMHARFRDAFAFLRSDNLADLAEGRHEIDGAAMYAIVARGPGRPRDAARLEAHRKYIDLQFVLSGTDEMGWKSRVDARKPDGAYDAAGDIEFFADTPDAWAATGPGAFAVFFPEDLHAPMIGTGELHKVIVKVAVEV